MRALVVIVTVVAIAATACADDTGWYTGEPEPGRLREAYRTEDPELLELAFQGLCVQDLDADESASAVRITATVDVGPLADCLGPVTVELDEPLGDRAVVDARSGREVEVHDAPVPVLSARTRPGSKEVELQFPCGTEVTALEVREERNAVHVEARGVDPHTADQCLATRTIELERPLGTRRLAAAQDDEVPVEVDAT